MTKAPRESKAIRDSADGMYCTMCSPACNSNTATTVWCHSNELVHDKGRGIKAIDVFGFYGCSACNHWYDSGNSASKAEKRDYLFFAMARSTIILLEKGLLTMKGAK